jgi:hypothetical protein
MAVIPPAPAPAPKPARRGPSRLVVVTTLLALLFGGAAVIGIAVVGPMAKDRVIEEARKRGVALELDGVWFWWWSATIEGARFQLIGVPGVAGRAATIDVVLDALDPSSIEANDVQVDAVGSAADLALALGEWTKAHPHAFEVPVSATSVQVSFRPSPQEAPWLRIEGGSMSRKGTYVVFDAAHAAVSGMDVGHVGATWTGSAAAVAMGFGETDLAAARVRMDVWPSATPPVATVVLSPTDLARLGGPLGVALPVTSVTASGRADLTFARGIEQGPIVGRLEARLDGYVPPHPVELDGFLFGNTTTFTSSFEVPADRTRVDLKNSRVRAGAFDLTGSGRIERQPDHATLRMSLGGNLPCAAVAASAAAAHTGSFLGSIVGAAARRVVDGSVAVGVTITADSRHLDAARVDRTIGVGCGLAPIAALGAEAIGRLPDRVRQLAATLPLPSVGVPLPKDAKLPALPQVPTSLPFPFPSAR